MTYKKLFDQDEYERWLNQAQNTLSSAMHDLSIGDYNWCCFKCQQSAEYAVKALLRGLGQIAVGHSILKLIGILETIDLSVSEEIRANARSLDMHYIPACYPDAYPAGAPFEFYDEKIAKSAVNSTKVIIDFIRKVKEKYV
ncbi:MAG: HEPN domain-containing protein [bacterium]